MKVVVEVISRETIKPSSPTPHHLRHHRLSYLDQITPSFYTSITLFFERNIGQPNITEISKHLKKSLAQALTLYYPLAGRADEAGNIVCNDEGAPYLVAQVINCKLSDVVHNPNRGELTNFVPFDLDDADIKVPFGVQLNVFECGGFAIGQCFTHKIADATSQFVFTKTWAAIARNCKAEIHRPEFISATLFPPKVFTHQPNPQATTTKNKVSKSYVFDASTIEHLRGEKIYASSSKQRQRRPSRNDALSSFIWSRFAAISEDEEDKLHAVVHAVNLRPRFNPPLSPHSFGNIVSGVTITLSTLSTREEYHGRIQQEMNKINKAYIKGLQQGGAHMSEMGLNQEGGEIKILTSVFTSVSGFPVYDNDFGWGRPTWVFVGIPGVEFNIMVLLVDTKDGNGMEAYISAAEEVVTKLESDEEFLRRIKPSALTKPIKSVQRSKI